jgi:transcriptional regulator with XRE-family HTH domain
MERGKHKKGITLPHLAAWRDARGLSQGDLAALAGVGVATLSRIENGANARYDTIDKLCKALRISRERLISGPPEKKDWAA